MSERYPGYDVLAKRTGPSWNAQTRRVVDQRLAVPREPRFLSASEFETLDAIASRVTPQPAGRPPIPVAALIDDRLLRGRQDGFRGAAMPREAEAWPRGLRAIDAEARAQYGLAFHTLSGERQDAILRRVAAGDAHHQAWRGMPPATFFTQRLLSDIVQAYWSHPTAWSEIGWGGPASPRGYVRMGYDRRDPWEAAEARADNGVQARRDNRRVR
ncbi:gluconate 2-dehydrogenase subunit 3 family protein [Rhodopila sp.]|uniref:gluconate 2-dehydrogenase subunit 3 family protein n=1 Tax=Rhodopila sp. TaxID=2480087 RepID=UPI002C26FE2F|nr:gluconate 2-dehydrogenase subunit 3 family protein [Rhodopila sp.]HVZ10285.1 gluconate 2-dehydrogenase subunit 3 family protein [Rhodopila sp.]